MELETHVWGTRIEVSMSCRHLSLLWAWIHMEKTWSGALNLCTGWNMIFKVIFKPSSVII